MIGPRSGASVPSILLGLGAAIVVAMAAAYYSSASPNLFDESSRHFTLAVVAIVGVPWALILLATLTGRIAAACLMTFAAAPLYLLGVGWLALLLFILSWEKELIEVLPLAVGIVQLGTLCAAIFAWRRIPATERAFPFAALVFALPLVVDGVLVAFAFKAFGSMQQAPAVRAANDAEIEPHFTRLTECLVTRATRGQAPGELRALDDNCAEEARWIESQSNYQVRYTRAPPDAARHDRFTLCLQPVQVPDSGLATFVSDDRGFAAVARAGDRTREPVPCSQAIPGTPTGLAKRFEYCAVQYWATLGRREYPATLDPIRAALPGCLDGATKPAASNSSRVVRLEIDYGLTAWLNYAATPRGEAEPGYWLYLHCSGTPAFAEIDAGGTILNADLPEAMAWLNQCRDADQVDAVALARAAGLRLPQGVSGGPRAARVMPPGPGDEPTFYGDPDLAARRAECSANVSACAGLGRELERAIGLAGGNTSREQTLNDETRGWLREARAAHVRACDAGVAQSCNAEASLARDALDRDARHVEKFYLRGCDGGFALSCSYLADIYARGLASTVPGIRSTRFAGEPEIRTPTGIDDPKRPAIAKDPARSAEFYRRACGLGDRDGCRLEGMTLQESAATAADPLRTRANEIFARLCHRGDSSSCMFLARNAEAAGGAIAGNSTAYWRTHTCLFGSGQYCER